MDDQKKKSHGFLWYGKTTRQKAGIIGIVLGTFLACTLLAYAAAQLFGSKSASISNVKGHTFEMDLTVTNSGIEVLPGTEQTLDGISIQNKSGTDNIYAFIGFDYDPAVYFIENVSGWELVDEENRVYSYSSDGSMNEINMNESASFSGTLTCVADAVSFQSLIDDDFAVDVTGYAISTEICSETNSQAWDDYQSGGNNAG